MAAFGTKNVHCAHLDEFTVAQCSKIRKKCNFKSSKTHSLQFQKWHKINSCTRKKFETTKNAILKLFSGAKTDSLPFLKMQTMLLCTFEIAPFPILEHCE